jgi:hypothetical protein
MKGKSTHMNRSRLATPFVSFLIFASISSLSTAARAATGGTSGEFEYPELLVTPRASDRLDTEAGKEPGSRLTAYLPHLVSGLSTLAAGLAQDAPMSKDPDSVSKRAGITVGGLWVAASAGLAAFYQPYSIASRESAAMPRKSARDQLTRERFSEVAIQANARLATRLKWLSIGTNLGANLYMLGKAGNGSFSQVLDGIAAALAFTPLVFRSHAEDVACEQEDYKKRIYAPVASAAMFAEPGTGAPAPGVRLSLAF